MATSSKRWTTAAGFAAAATAMVAGIWILGPQASADETLQVTGLTGVPAGGVVSGRVAIEAKVDGRPDSVVFHLDGAADLTRTERVAPYFFGGDNDGSPFGWDSRTVSEGTYTLTAVASRGSTTASRSVTFTVDQDGRRPPAPPTTPAPTDPSKPKLWVTSDMSEPGGETDADDISALAALSVYASKFSLASVVVGGEQRITDCAGAMTHARNAYGAYLKNLALSSTCGLQGGFTTCTASNPWVKNPPATVKALIEAVRAGGLTVLNWGPMTESAGAACWLEHNAPQDLAKLSIVSHWTVTSPGFPIDPNCGPDRSACEYVHELAGKNKIKLIELGAAGQKFINTARGACDANVTIPKKGLGVHLNAKYAGITPDFSDSITFLVFLHGGIADYDTSGKGDANFDKAYDRVCAQAPAIFDDLRAAAK
ncbi:hypothetical protein [Micromonospora coxensis]|uniref:Uncharacterized protein n=1 Tax=Micromonospora coxensis TaxID=356852 RepID=A0A1C5GUH1_9ACTN|nr:hypothetical protein [Micromonospora coxensis]SCG37414.1 hypothetical protein GA0070614_0391 [Micromonospora coxensis]